MLNYILRAIALASISVFFYAMFIRKGNKNAFFISFIIILYPFIRINIIPSLMEFSLFDFFIISYYLFFYRKKVIRSWGNIDYRLNILVLFTSVIIGFFTVNEFTLASSELLIQLISIALFAIVVMDELSYNKEFFYEIIDKMKIPVIFSFIFLGCQFIFGVEFSISKQLNSNILSEIVVRYPSYFQDPQKYSQFLAATSFLMLINTQTKKKLNFLSLIIAITSVVCILFAGGRAGLTGWVLGMAIIMIFGIGKYRKILATAFIFISIIAFSFSSKFSIFQREALDESYNFRLSIWEAAYEIFTKHPILGIGAGNYSNYVSIHNPDQFWIADNEIIIYDHPESGYLKLLIEFGLIGFISIMSILLIPLAKGFFRYIKNKNINILLFICAIISWMVGFYSVYSIGDIRISVLIVIIFCMLISELQKENGRIEKNSKPVI